MSLLYSKLNHLDFSSKIFPLRGKCLRSPGLFRDECLLAAAEISEAYESHPLYVFLSGGADSEVVAESFRLQRIPFRAAIIRYSGDFNIQDISWAIVYCEEKQVEYEIFDIDLLALNKLKSSAAIAKEIRTAYLSHIGIAKVAKHLFQRDRGVSIIGMGEPEIVRDVDLCSVVQIESEYYMGRFLKNRNIPGVPCFYEWSPELYSSFILSNEIQGLLYWGVQFYRNSVPVKADLYFRSFGTERRLKLGGSERINALYPQIRTLMKKNYNAKIKYVRYESFMERLFSRSLSPKPI